MSPPARAVAEANGAAAYTRLVVRGGGTQAVRGMLSSLRPESVLGVPVQSTDDARAVVAGLWLWHDWLDESHSISQNLATSHGSFWHAIMHRREGDFSNAKYWYARCRHHPALDRIPTLARATLGAAATTTGPLHGVLDDGWDPDAFVDAVEAVHRTPDDPLHATAVTLQQLEWRALFEHCVRAAAGTPR